MPNTARGVVKTTSGKPVSDVTVDIWGRATANGGIVDYEPSTSATGAYQQAEMTPGTYTALAWKVVRYNNITYRVPMSPVQGKIEDQYLSKNGIARDFVWKISGPIPSKFFDPDKVESYYGGSLKVYGTDDSMLNKLVLPEGSVLKGTLVPDGPLLDGSTGKTITFQAPYKAGELYETIQKDIPLGCYTLTLTATLPEGETKTIRLYDGDGHEESDYKNSATVEFLPSGSGMRPFQSYFIKGAGIFVKL